MKLRLKCTCGAVLTADASMQGKRGRCRKCGHTFTVPKRKRAKKPTPAVADFSAESVSDWLADGPSAANESTANDFAGDFQSDRATTTLTKSKSGSKHGGKKCPSCSGAIHDAIVCMHCGYHTRLKRKLETLDSEHAASSMWFALLISLPFCLLYVAAAYLTLDSLSGPMFLRFFFAGFCVLGILTPVLRKLWLDSDVFNYLAFVTLEAAGMIRLIHALSENNYKISFLLLGMVLVPLVFLLPRTGTSNEFSESYQSERGGLAVVPYSVLCTVVLVVIAAVLFVPFVSEVVVSLGVGLPFIIGVIVFCTLNPGLANAAGGSLQSASCSGGHHGFGSLSSYSSSRNYSNSRNYYGGSSFSSFSSCGGGGGGGFGGGGGGGFGGCGG